ncbi:hypothetical protein FSST1_011443 [Fusarium sambucinum]
MALRLTFLLMLVTQTLSQRVRIFDQIPQDVNQCIKPCLFRPNNANTDVGGVLDCDTPYKQDCYCATNGDKVKLVSEHIDTCAQASCSAGVESQDASSMRSYYASYCMENGYTADVMTEWYTGTVIEEATRTDKNVWGWSTATDNSRSDVFDDEKEDGGANVRAVDLLFLGVPLLATLFQLA